MSYSEYWLDRPILAKSYRKAYEMKKIAKNQELWLQGVYVQKAFQTVMDIFTWGLNGGKGQKPEPAYPKTPIPITEWEIEEEKKRNIEHTLEFIRKGQEDG